MSKFRKISLMLVLLCGVSALADTVNFNTASGFVVGSFGVSQATLGGIQVNAYYYKNGAWQAANLFGRNQAPDDVGLGICDPSETANCGTGQNGGDYNEISNEIYPEIIRLKLPT